MNDLVSIIMPVYQVENYIRNSVLSVCNQSYKNIEIILVNDGTKDRSIEIAKEIIEKNKLIYKVINQNNVGVSEARNIGIKAASGEWFICIDSDDIIHKDMIKILTKLNAENNTYVAATNYIVIKNSNSIQNSKNSIKSLIIEKKTAINNFLNRKLRIIAPGILINKRYILDYKIFYEKNVKFSEDIIYIWNLLLNTNKISYSNSPLYFYLIHPNSTMTSSNLNKILSGYEGICFLANSIQEIEGTPDYLKRYIKPRWILSVLKSSTKMLNYLDWEKLLVKMEYKEQLNNLKGFPDIRVPALANILKMNRKLFYNIFRNM